MSARALRVPLPAGAPIGGSLASIATTALAAGAAVYLSFLAVAVALPPGAPVGISDNYAASPGFVLEIWLNNLAIAGAVWALWLVFARRDDWDRLRFPFVALVMGLGALWAVRAGMVAAELGGREIGLGALVRETAPHAVPELALILVPTALTRRGSRPSLLLLAGIALSLLACAAIEGYV